MNNYFLNLIQIGQEIYFNFKNVNLNISEGALGG